ncbi:MAG: hypothetical protein AB9917_00010 [Negativicutes bacterium]
MQRYNDIQTAFEGAPKDKMTLFQKGAAQLKNITQRVQLATEGTKVGSVIESAGRKAVAQQAGCRVWPNLHWAVW